MGQVTFSKLEDGAWGIKVYDMPSISTGDETFVAKRNGGGKQVTVGELVRTDYGGKSRVFRVVENDEPETSQPDPRQEQELTVTEPGVYETDEGVFVVKWNQPKTNLYAKKLVEINADRATEDGDRVQIEFEYEAGAIYRITNEDRMPVERAKKLAIRYGKCIACGAKLKAAKSVEDGIGPVCIKKFGPITGAVEPHSELDFGDISEDQSPDEIAEQVEQVYTRACAAAEVDFSDAQLRRIQRMMWLALQEMGVDEPLDVDAEIINKLDAYFAGSHAVAA